MPGQTGKRVTKAEAAALEKDETGVKFKLAHKRADKQTWSASTTARRKKAVADEMEQQIAEDEKKVGPFRALKRKTARRQGRVAA